MLYKMSYRVSSPGFHIAKGKTNRTERQLNGTIPLFIIVIHGCFAISVPVIQEKKDRHDLFPLHFFV